MLDGLKSKKKSKFEYGSDEEEVLGLDDDEDVDSDIDEDQVFGSGDEDEEEKKQNTEMSVSGAWGRKKSAYYSGNRIENEEDAALEEEEALALQAKMMKQLDSNDFGLDAFAITKKDVFKTNSEISANKIAATAFDDDTAGLQKVTKNLSKMSKSEKLELLKQTSPELMELVSDFKVKLTELRDSLLPIFKKIKSNQMPLSTATEYIVNKTRLYLMYCCHLSFYFVLKSENVSVENHPIVKNILQFRNLCKQISAADEVLKKEVKVVLSAIKNNEQMSFGKAKERRVKFKLNGDDLEAESNDEEVEGADDGSEAKIGKRAIGYDIAKNKGLTPKRNKMYRNPRVRNRIKSRKAQIKHKSIVPKVRPQEKRYAGEATGIRMGVVRAVKIK